MSGKRVCLNGDYDRVRDSISIIPRTKKVEFTRKFVNFLPYCKSANRRLIIVSPNRKTLHSSAASTYSNASRNPRP